MQKSLERSGFLFIFLDECMIYESKMIEVSKRGYLN